MEGEARSHLRVGLATLGAIGICLASAVIGRQGVWSAIAARKDAPLATAPPYTPWPTPPVALTFDFPLQPAEAYGPYVQGVTGSRAIDTRFGSQNPALGNRSNCFRDRQGNPVPFQDLYHAGVDLFALNPRGGLAWGEARHAPVLAVADGVTAATLDAGAEGQIVITEHRLDEDDAVYSVYWHVTDVQVAPGQPVERGQSIGLVHDQGLNSHLHWEMRTFADGTSIFPAGTAGARGRCNENIAGVAYTWDDDPDRAKPGFYGYLDPLAFVEARQ